MAGLIKGQILKHLSKFTKNLAPDKINVSTLKGEGELSNLELDEAVLTNLLDLPTWLRITKAVCTRAAIKIQWTKLKSQPICLYLDEIVVEMETCDVPRQPAADSPLTAASAGAKYGFAEKIIDGMFVSINSVVVNFRAQAFAASIQLSRILIQSKTPTWHSAGNDLRLTRIKDEVGGEIILFKEAEWQTLRIEANALEGAEHLATTPLRLIANQSKIRITIKKRLTDCGIIASRLQFNLDDLLWVLTDSQLKAALVFVNSLREVVSRSTKQSKKLAAEKLKKQGNVQSPVHAQVPVSRPQPQKNVRKAQQSIMKLFEKYDVKETSYHLYTGRIDLHLCDDAAPEDENHRRKVEGGAMQLTLYKLAVDHYPFHPAGGDRSYWLRYDDNMIARDAWAKELLATFKDDVRKVREFYMSPKTSPSHAHPPSPGNPSQPQPSPVHTAFREDPSTQQGQGQGHPNQPAAPRPQGVKVGAPSPRQTKLLESCVVVRLEDFTLYRVSTASDHQRSIPKKFLSSEKKQLLLPQEMSSIHAEYTDYYFPEGIDYPEPDQSVESDNSHCGNSEPVPHANIYVVINPVRLLLDYLTVLWLNAFALNLLKKAELPTSEGPKMHADIKLDALMPRFILPSEGDVLGQADRPEMLNIHLSRLSATNVRQEPHASHEELGKVLGAVNGKLFTNRRTSFPRESGDLVCIPPHFENHVHHRDAPYFDKSVEDIILLANEAGEGGVNAGAATIEGGPCRPNLLQKSESMTGLTYYNMNTDSFKLDASKDVWCVAIDQFWMEFNGVPSSHNRPVPFLESFPLTLWLTRPSLLSPSSPVASNEPSAPTVNHVQDTNGHSRGRNAKLLKSYYSFDEDSPPEGLPDPIIQSHDHTERSHDPAETESHGVSCDSVEEIGDLHIVCHVGTKVCAQINHYQYLFLMRLIDTLVRCLTEMEEDTLFINKEPPPVQRIVLALALHSAEVALICPPIPEVPSLPTSSREDSEVFGLFEEYHPHTAGGAPVCEIPWKDGVDSALGASISGRSQDAVDQVALNLAHADLADLDDSTPSTPDLPPEGSPFIISEGHDLCDPLMNDKVNGTTVESLPDICVTDATTPPATMTQSTTSLSGQPPSPAHLQRWGSAPDNRRASQGGGPDNKSMKSAFSLIQKGLGNSYSKITEKMKQNMAKASHLEYEDGSGASDDWETMSQKSGSSDDEDYLLLRFQNALEAPAFESKFSSISDDTVSMIDVPGSDVAPPIDSSSLATLNSAMDRARGVVSILSFRVHAVEVAIQSVGKDTSVSALVGKVEPHEHGNVNLDKFQAKFSQESDEKQKMLRKKSGLKGDTEAEILPPDIPPISLRFQNGPKAELLAPTAGERGYLRAEVSGLQAKLLMSSLTSLGELFEDEKQPPVMPMAITIRDSYITLRDDKPPTHGTSAGKAPIDLCVSRLLVTQGEDGVLQIAGLPSETAPPELDLTPFATPQKLTPPDQTTELKSDLLRDSSDDPDHLHKPPGEIRRKSSEGMSLQERIGQLELTLQAERLHREQLQVHEKDNMAPSHEMVASLEGENEMLRRQLEKIGKMSTAEGGFNVETLQQDCDHYKAQAAERRKLKRENAEMMEQLTQQTEHLLMVKQERENLLMIIQQLQEDLEASEQLRSRLPPRH